MSTALAADDSSDSAASMEEAARQARLPSMPPTTQLPAKERSVTVSGVRGAAGLRRSRRWERKDSDRGQIALNLLELWTTSIKSGRYCALVRLRSSRSLFAQP